jgi:putative hemolysin
MHTESSRQGPVLKLSFRWESTTQSKLLPVVSGALERVLLFDQLRALYDRALHLEGGRAFHEKVLEELGVHYEVPSSDLARIPAHGPVVVTANHPFGAVEGIILATVLRSVRPDVKVMANFLLGGIPELRDLFILVDPFARQVSTYANVRGLREALTWLKQGGMLAAFP